jgi:hypothetical protein
MIAVKLCIEHFGLFRAIFFAKKNLFIIARNFEKKKGRFHLSSRAAFVSGLNFFDIFQHILKRMSLILKLFALLWDTNRDVSFTQTQPPKLS